MLSILGIEIIVDDVFKPNMINNELMGIMIQYPDTEGSILDLETVIKSAKNSQVYFYVYLKF